MSGSLFERLGVIRTTIFLSVLSILLSVLIAIVIRLVAGIPISGTTVLISAIVPLVLAPPLIYVGTRTVLELVETRNKLLTMANFDVLTGVPNRAHFIHLAEEALMEAPAAQPVGLVVFDIDRFKLINDTYGHLVGDEALKMISRTVRVHLREGDIFGRFGGDEFILLTPDTSSTELQTLCHLLLTHIQTLSVGIKDVRTRLSTTMGVTSAVPSAVNLNDLIARADAALLQAKRQGGGRVRYV
jgi:diguanylate cyclase (GGDEF)-like protein